MFFFVKLKSGETFGPCHRCHQQYLFVNNYNIIGTKDSAKPRKLQLLKNYIKDTDIETSLDLVNEFVSLNDHVEI